MNWLVPATIFLLPAYLIRFLVAGIPTTVLEVLIYLCVLGLLISQPLATTGSRLRMAFRQYGLPIALFILGSLIATAIAPDKRIALGLLKAYVLDPILLFMVLAAWVDSTEKFRRILLALLASGVFVGLSAILGMRNLEGRALGLYAIDINPSPNFLALYLTPIAALAIGLLQKTKSHLIRPGWLAFGIAIMLTGIFLSASRGGLLAIGITYGLAIIWLIGDRTKRLAGRPIQALVLLFLAVALAVGGWLARPDFSQNASHRATTSNNLRYEIWRTTLVDIIPARPLSGVGLGNYQNYFTEITQNRVNFPEFIAPWALTPHNLFLTIWVNLGLFGLIGLLWLISWYFTDAAKIKDPALRRGLMLAMTALMVHGLVDSTYWKNDLSTLFWILLALAPLAVRLTRKDSNAV